MKDRYFHIVLRPGRYAVRLNADGVAAMQRLMEGLGAVREIDQEAYRRYRRRYVRRQQAVPVGQGDIFGDGVEGI